MMKTEINWESGIMTDNNTYLSRINQSDGIIMDKSKLIKDKKRAMIIMDKIRYLYQRYEEREYQGLNYQR